MKSSLLLLALVVAAMSSCTTAYKTGQTPDDVYYSPTRPQDEYVRIEKEDDRRYRYEEDFQEDRYLRMKIRNRNQWSDLNDWYAYERFGFGHNYYYGSYNNPYNTWNYYYNPYCSHTVFVNTSFTANAPKPRMANLNTYNPNNNSTVSNPKTQFSNPKYSLPGNTNNGYNSNTYTITTTLPPTVLRDITLHRLLPAVHPAVRDLLLAAAPRYAVFNTITETMTGFVNNPAKLESLFTTCNLLNT
jgi:hypothetical protein